MVAAWISADTGVGPAMASPSQLCSGNCADAAGAEQENSPKAVTALAGLADAGETEAKSTFPYCQNMIMIATDRPRSPTRLTTNALFAAVAYAGL